MSFTDKKTAGGVKIFMNGGSGGEPVRCPECGDVVPHFFHHIDVDCTGTLPEMVAAGKLKPRLRVIKEIKL